MRLQLNVTGWCVALRSRLRFPRARNLDDWKGDRVELNVEDVNVQILYEDEELGWFKNMKSNGWMWPREWS